MEKELFKDLSPELRKQALEDNADEVFKGNYTRKFSDTERNMRRARNSEIDLELEAINDEVAQFKEGIKARRNPLVEEKKKILGEIKSNGEYINGTCYKLIDYEKKEVCIYNEDGDLVESRKLTTADRQRVMKFANTGTED